MLRQKCMGKPGVQDEEKCCPGYATAVGAALDYDSRGDAEKKAFKDKRAISEIKEACGKSGMCELSGSIEEGDCDCDRVLD